MNFNRLKCYLGLLSLLCVLNPVNAQVRFQRIFGGIGSDRAKVVSVTPGGGYTVLGYTGGSFGTDGIYFLRLDQSGDTLSTHVIDILSDDGKFVENSDGSFTMSGTGTGFGQGEAEIYLMKINSMANVLWVRSYGGASHDFSNSVELVSGGGFIISGRTQSFGTGLVSGYLIKTDMNGDSIWTRVIGGTGLDGANYAINTQDGNFVMVGQTNSFGAGANDVYAVKVDNSGDTLWTKTFGGVDNDLGSIVKNTDDGGVIILGGSASFGDGSIYLIRLDINGDTLWTKHYGSDCGESAWGIRETNDKGFIIAGETCSFGATVSDAYMLRIDSVGEVIWSRTYKWDNNFENVFYDVKQTADGGFISVGKTGNLTSSSFDIYVVKTDANGNSGCGDSLVISNVGNTSTMVSSTNSSITSGGVMDSVNVNVISVNTQVNLLCIDSIVGINPSSKPLANKGLKVFPNPFSSYTTIETYIPDGVINGEIVVYNLLGVIQQRYVLTEGYNAITVLNEDLLGTGLYFYALRYNGELVERRKMILIK